MSHPLNTILYGPPGTGKTYATFRRCVEICDGSEAGEQRDEDVHERYRELVEEQRVAFITFHQSYGYEEFVEGLRPETEGDGGGLRLKVRDGVLKRIAERARSARAPVPGGKRRFFKVELRAEGIFEECMKDGCVRFVPWPGNGRHDEYWDRDRWSDSRYDTYDAVTDGIVEDFRPKCSKKTVMGWGNTPSLATIRARMKRGDIVVVPCAGAVSSYRAVGEIVGDYEYARRSSPRWFPHRRAVRWRQLDEPHPVKAFQGKDLGKGQPVHKLRPDRPEALLRHLRQQQPYVLVIDEINRANIAKVLGELITLLEEDKREGAENEIAVTLPHSNESFTLPPHLHVLGTMNTADRSIALLDTALRRRFVFEEITPNPVLLEDAKNSTGVDLPAVLDAMNNRLEWLVGRDHLIGHAWFLRAKSGADVDEIMRRKVIPLIAEYFYDDWEKVRAVLGGTDAFVQRETLDPPPGLQGGGESRYRWTVVQDPFRQDAYDELVSGGSS